MLSKWSVWILVVLLSKHTAILCSSPDSGKLGSPKHDGHLKPFGCCGDGLAVPEVPGFPPVREFWENHALKGLPLKMDGAFSGSRAVRLWDDEYFLNLDVPPESRVLVESRKKEDRKGAASMMNFQDFVSSYNKTDQYMVESLPEYLKPDVPLPASLLCSEILEAKMILDVVMWFSSGGTKSVVHTDDSDNMNCLIRGTKKLVLVNPKQKHLINLDHEDGSYSDIDVEKANYTKYPGLAYADYYHVHMQAGDCLFIPFHWIHQVTSFDRNIAVNVWWDTSKNKRINLDHCDSIPEQDITMDTVEWLPEAKRQLIEGIMTDFYELLESGQTYTEVQLAEFFGIGASVHEATEEAEVENPSAEVGESVHEATEEAEVENSVNQILKTVDKNRNGVFDKKDLQDITEDEWLQVIEVLVAAGLFPDVDEDNMESGLEQDVESEVDPDMTQDGTDSKEDGNNAALDRDQREEDMNQSSEEGNEVNVGSVNRDSSRSEATGVEEISQVEPAKDEL